MSFVNVRLRHIGGRRIRIEKKEEEKLNNMTEEEKYEYFMIKKLQQIWNKLRL